MILENKEFCGFSHDSMAVLIPPMIVTLVGPLIATSACPAKGDINIINRNKINIFFIIVLCSVLYNNFFGL